jgi:hypothetical protein
MFTMQPPRALVIGRRDGAAPVERGLEVDVDDGVDVLVGHAHEQVVARDAGDC